MLTDRLKERRGAPRTAPPPRERRRALKPRGPRAARRSRPLDASSARAARASAANATAALWANLSGAARGEPRDAERADEEGAWADGGGGAGEQRGAVNVNWLVARNDSRGRAMLARAKARARSSLAAETRSGTQS